MATLTPADYRVRRVYCQLTVDWPGAIVLEVEVDRPTWQYVSVLRLRADLRPALGRPQLSGGAGMNAAAREVVREALAAIMPELIETRRRLVAAAGGPETTPGRVRLAFERAARPLVAGGIACVDDSAHRWTVTSRFGTAIPAADRPSAGALDPAFIAAVTPLEARLEAILPILRPLGSGA